MPMRSGMKPPRLRPRPPVPSSTSVGTPWYEIHLEGEVCGARIHTQSDSSTDGVVACTEGKVIVWSLKATPVKGVPSRLQGYCVSLMQMAPAMDTSVCVVLA